MSPEILIGIGIAVFAIVVALAIRFMNRPQEIEMNSYSGNLAQAVEKSYSPESSASNTGDFRFTVEDIFSIKGRGLVVTGRVESGRLLVGQRVKLSLPDSSDRLETTVKGIESFRKQQDMAQAGDNVGLLLASLTKEQVKKGMVLTLVG